MALTAEAKEVCHGARGDVVEQFKVDVVIHAAESQLQLCVLAGLRCVDHLPERVLGKSLIDDAH